MNTFTPAKDIDRLIDRLAHALNTDLPLDEATLSQTEWQARKCERTDPQDTHMALGMLAGLRQNRTEADKHFQDALRRGWRPLIALNYAAVLHRLYGLEDALQQAYHVVQKGPGGYFVPALERALQCAYEMGRFHAASDLMTLIRKSADAPYAKMTNALAAALPPLVQAADALALTDDMMATATHPTWVIISRQSNKRMQVEINDFIGNDGSLFLSRTLLLPVAFEQARRMDLELMTLQAESEIPLSKFCVSLRDKPAL